MIALKTDRDSALQLWNSTVEERKQLHDQQMSLTQARDDSLRQTFSHHEEISLLKSERDQLRRELERVRKFIQNNSHLSLNNRGGGGGENDSGFVSSNVPSPSADVSCICTFTFVYLQSRINNSSKIQSDDSRNFEAIDLKNSTFLAVKNILLHDISTYLRFTGLVVDLITSKII